MLKGHLFHEPKEETRESRGGIMEREDVRVARE